MKNRKSIIVWLLVVFILCISSSSMVMAKEKKPESISGKKCTMCVSETVGLYGNYLSGATYSISTNKKGMIEVTSYFDKKKLGFCITAKKTGICKIILKQKYNGKISHKNFTIKIIANKNKPLFMEYYDKDSYYVVKGIKFSLFSNGLMDCDGKTSFSTGNFSSSDPTIATVNNQGIVTTKKEGTVRIVAKNGTKSNSIELCVKSGKVASDASNLVSQINELTTKKITKSNYKSIYKQMLDLKKKEKKLRTKYSYDYCPYPGDSIVIPFYRSIEDIEDNLEKYIDTSTISAIAVHHPLDNWSYNYNDKANYLPVSKMYYLRDGKIKLVLKEKISDKQVMKAKFYSSCNEGGKYWYNCFFVDEKGKCGYFGGYVIKIGKKTIILDEIRLPSEYDKYNKSWDKVKCSIKKGKIYYMPTLSNNKKTLSYKKIKMQ